MTTRRSALVLIAAGVLPDRVTKAQHQMHKAQAHPEAYRLQFFTPDEHGVLDQLTEMILPSGERAPGAHAAHVADFIDLVIANSGADVQQRWRSGLQALGGTAGLERTAAEEKMPVTPAGRFFVELKRMTIHGYYTSEIGLRQELGYLGPEVLSSFPGCKS